MNEIKPVMSAIARLERTDDGAQIVVLPPGFELPLGEVNIRRDGDRLIVEPRKSLLEALDEMEPLTIEEWPDITDDDLPPLRDVIL
ncbi:antitoxin [Devosia sp. A449]